MCQGFRFTLGKLVIALGAKAVLQLAYGFEAVVYAIELARRHSNNDSEAPATRLAMNEQVIAMGNGTVLSTYTVGKVLIYVETFLGSGRTTIRLPLED